MPTQNLTRAKGRHKVKRLEAFDTTLDVEGEFSVSGDLYQLAVLPKNALIKVMSLIIVTTNDAATSAVVDIGIDGDTSLADDFDLTGAPGVTTTHPDLWEPNGGVINCVPTFVGVPTEGKFIMHLEYTVIGKADGNFTEILNS